MSLRVRAAVVGVAERAPQRQTGKETNLDLLSGVAVKVRFETIDDSDVSLPVFTLFP